ncbi:C4-dicarboxylate ABC transporter [Thermoplasmatales archaeon ex4484_6]|nr:MAG: C4-dicarboxylate ABC transporter [Thermoplasmatales archaeon ex4484_6]RLF65767.1 MAG: C4-dicarboxylate ABC transporter [Thermoplasmata archaeon]
MLRDIKCKCEIVKNFAPSWFASIMGTGILALTSDFYSQYIPWLKEAALALFYFNVILFFVLLIPWILRWVLFKKESYESLKHPINSNFYPTISVGMMVLSSDFLVIGKNDLMGSIFWFSGAAITVLFGIYLPYSMFKGDHVRIEHINPAWFIPPVGLIVIPIAGSLLIDKFTGTVQELVVLTNFVGWGAGFFIYLFLLALVTHRFILHKPLPNILAPTIWINLGPIGAGTVALINLVQHSSIITVKEPFLVFGMIFWGFGIWWAAIAILMTVHYIRRLKLPYAMSWWAFTFPLGAYVAASHVVAKTFSLEIVDYVGFALFLLLVCFWVVTFINTVRYTYHGTVFK